MIVSYHNIMNYLGMAFLLVDLVLIHHCARCRSRLKSDVLYLQALIRSFRRRPDAHALF